MTEREALKLAQMALSNKRASDETVYNALHAIRQALATTSTKCEVQPEQEPVAFKCGDAIVHIKPPVYGATPPQRKPLTDEQIRKLWAKYAAKQNGWPNDTTPPMIDIGNGPRFQAHWHESEYQVFKAGFKAAHGIKE